MLKERREGTKDELNGVIFFIYIGFVIRNRCNYLSVQFSDFYHRIHIVVQAQIAVNFRAFSSPLKLLPTGSLSYLLPTGNHESTFCLRGFAYSGNIKEIKKWAFKLHKLSEILCGNSECKQGINRRFVA